MTEEAILGQLTDIFRYVFDYDGGPLTLEMTSHDIKAWDSMSNITLAIEIENRFEIKVRTAEMEALKNVGDLIALVQSHLPLTAP